MLGRLEMSVDECIDAFCDLSKDVFGKPKLVDSTDPLAARFDAVNLETRLRGIIRSADLDENALFLDRHYASPLCKVYGPRSTPSCFLTLADSSAP